MDLLNHLLPHRLQIHQYALATYLVEVDPGVTPQQALDPNFWAHLAPRLKPGDEIVVRPTTFAWRLHAEIVARDRADPPHWAMLRPITLSEDSAFAIGADDESGYRIDHDPVQGWRILQGRSLVVRDLPDEAAAKAKVAELKNPKPAVKKAG